MFADLFEPPNKRCRKIDQSYWCF